MALRAPRPQEHFRGALELGEGSAPWAEPLSAWPRMTIIVIIIMIMIMMIVIIMIYSYNDNSNNSNDSNVLM